MSSRLNTVLLIAILAAACGAVAAPFMAALMRQSSERADIEDAVAMAGILRNEGLTERAAETYRRALDSPLMDSKKKSNICYVLGDILLNEKRDFEGAQAYFLKAKHYDPASPQKTRIDEGIVQCLERMGRSLDAKNKLKQATSLKPGPAPQGAGAIIAKVGQREITSGEAREALDQIGPSAQSQIQSKDAWIHFVRSYARVQQLKNAAVREGIDKESSYLSRLSRVEDELLAQTYAEREVSSKITVSEAEAKLYYKENEKEFTTLRRVEASYEESAAQKKKGTEKDGATKKAGAKTDLANSNEPESGGEEAKIVVVVEGQDRIGALGSSAEAAKAILALEKAGGKTEALPIGEKQYVFTATKVEPASTRPFDQVRRQVEARVHRQKEKQAQDALFERLSQVDPVVIYDDRITTAAMAAQAK